jgi:hypothetical protein
MHGYFENHDELYWNVTGLDWAFPIDKTFATVTLSFAGDPQIHSVDAYTGPMGAKGKDYSVQKNGPATVSFAVERTLIPHEGLTVVVGWPKGFVLVPDRAQKVAWLLKDNVNLIAIVIGYIGMLLYLVPVWQKHGRDPDPGLVVARYEPPEGFSPASLRYIQQMHYDNKVMTAAVLSLAVKGYLRIEKYGKKHTLVRLDPGADAPSLATGERTLYKKLFDDGDELLLDDKHYKRIGGAQSAHVASLRRDYAGRYFKTNGLLGVPAFFHRAAFRDRGIERGPWPNAIRHHWYCADVHHLHHFRGQHETTDRDRPQSPGRGARVSRVPGNSGERRNESPQPSGEDAAIVRELSAVRAGARCRAGLGGKIQ